MKKNPYVFQLSPRYGHQMASIVENIIFVVGIESTSIKEWFYHTDSKKLSVTFQNETDYDYYNVPFTTIVALLSTDSVGKTINELVKPNHEYEKRG